MAPHSPAVKLQSRAAPAPSSAMGAHRWSRPIAKGPPRKIRIVHVLAPEVIKTDPRHFRDLVQRLTGKPKGGAGSSSSWSPESAAAESSSQQAAAGGSSSVAVAVAPEAAAATVKAEVKEEEEDAASPEEGLGRAFGEAGGTTTNDAFFQDLDEFLLGGWL